MTTRFDPPADEVLSPVECIAVVARAFWNEGTHGRTWSELTVSADDGDVAATAQQATFMRFARALVDTVLRQMAVVRHRNPLSDAERQRTAEAALRMHREGPPTLREHQVTKLDGYDQIGASVFGKQYEPAMRAYAREIARLSES